MKTADAFNNKKAFIAFLTCGDPDIETTEKLIPEMERAGADLIELGIPFSDPTAEGPVIQAANERALKAGITTDKIFDMVRRIKDKVNIPLVFMTYANVVYSYGTERFIKTASDIGMSGIILPDVPFEEKSEFSVTCEKYGLDFISLIAPTSKNRIETIAKEASGFIYCVSSLGVTGVRSSISTNVAEIVEHIRNATDIPVAIGFGISTPVQAHDMAACSDGIIIGSAIIKIVEKYGRECIPHVYDYMKEIRQAI